MNCLLVPTLAIDIGLLDRLAKSIDYFIPNKVVVNNGKSEWIEQWKSNNPDWQVLQTNKNLGVAGSWNLAPIHFWDDTWLILNDDQELQPGCLEKICKSMDANPDADIHYVNEFQAYDIFGWTRKAVSTFGLFDENFFPAYFEDWEMRLRFKIGGAKINAMDGIIIKHGKPQAAGSRYMEMLAKFKPINEEYFLRKWGAISDEKTDYKTPFNNADFKIKDWRYENIRGMQMRFIWDEFMKEPTLYD